MLERAAHCAGTMRCKLLFCSNKNLAPTRPRGANKWRSPRHLMLGPADAPQWQRSATSMTADLVSGVEALRKGNKQTYEQMLGCACLGWNQVTAEKHKYIVVAFIKHLQGG